MIWSADWTFTHLTKLHKQQPKLVDAALQKMIESNPDLAWSLVVSAYLDEEINFLKSGAIGWSEIISWDEICLNTNIMSSRPLIGR